MPSKTKAKPAPAKPRSNGSAYQTGTLDAKSKEPVLIDSAVYEGNPHIVNVPHNQMSHAPIRSAPLPPTSENPDQNGTTTGINRKKQKRRLKEAAKKAATDINQADASVDESLGHSMPDPLEIEA